MTGTPTTPFEKEFRLWSKGERVILKAYPKLAGVVEEEGRLYPFVRWPGQDRSRPIHTSEILPYEGQSEAPIDEGEQTHLVLYRGRNDGLYMAMSASSSALAQEFANALTAATGNPHWVDLAEDVVRSEGSNRVYWKP